MYVTEANKLAIKAATFAINLPDPGFKPGNRSFLFFKRRKIPYHSSAVTFSEGLHGMGTGMRRLQPVSFFSFENGKKKVFHYSLCIKTDLERKPGFRKVNAV